MLLRALSATTFSLERLAGLLGQSAARSMPANDCAARLRVQFSKELPPFPMEPHNRLCNAQGTLHMGKARSRTHPLAAQRAVNGMLAMRRPGLRIQRWPPKGDATSDFIEGYGPRGDSHTLLVVGT